MWLFERRHRPSEKNGLLTIRRYFGRSEVRAGGYQQTGERLNAIWRDALTRVKESVAPRPNILLLGLGAGGILKELRTAFPGCRVKAVEHDAAMIALARELRLYEPYPEPAILHADAGEAMPSIQEKFDLVVVDLFYGNEPSPLLANKIFLAALKEKLAQKGVMLVNVCSQTHYLDLIQKFFPIFTRWKHKQNTLGSFRLSL